MLVILFTKIFILTYINVLQNYINIVIVEVAVCQPFIEQEVWPPSADIVCLRLPLMTQVGLQHWAKTAQTDHMILRP